MNKHTESRFDRALRDALHDVEVPAGLQERLLAELQSGAADQGPGSAPPTFVRKLGQLGVGRLRLGQLRLERLRLGRRQLIALATCAAAILVAIGLGVRSWIESRHIIEQEQIASALGGWQKALSKSRAEKGLPSDFVLPPLAVKPVKYVPFKTDEGWSAVAVDCTPPSGTPATLFIVRSSARFRVPAAPYTRLAGSRGKGVAAWQEGRLLYVLVVEESGSQRLEDFVRRPSYLRWLKRRSAVRST